MFLLDALSVGYVQHIAHVKGRAREVDVRGLIGAITDVETRVGEKGT